MRQGGQIQERKQMPTKAPTAKQESEGRKHRRHNGELSRV